MALIICKYHVPYIQYNLFGDYIAKNLCVNRHDENSSCRGKCFLNKQINAVTETEDISTTGSKTTVIFATDDYTAENALLQALLSFIKTRFFPFVIANIPKTCRDVLVPPPEQLNK